MRDLIKRRGAARRVTSLPLVRVAAMIAGAAGWFLASPARPQPVVVAQEPFSNVALAQNPSVTTIVSGLTVTLPPSNGPRGNWRVWVRVRGVSAVTFGGGASMTRVAYGITGTTLGSDPVATFSHGTGVCNRAFINCMADDSVTVQGFTGDAVQQGFATPEYSATYASGAKVTVNLVAIPSSANRNANVAAGYLEIFAEPQ
jgi:hypothetical protein